MKVDFVVSYDTCCGGGHAARCEPIVQEMRNRGHDAWLYRLNVDQVFTPDHDTDAVVYDWWKADGRYFLPLTIYYSELVDSVQDVVVDKKWFQNTRSDGYVAVAFGSSDVDDLGNSVLAELATNWPTMKFMLGRGNLVQQDYEIPKNVVEIPHQAWYNVVGHSAVVLTAPGRIAYEANAMRKPVVLLAVDQKRMDDAMLMLERGVAQEVFFVNEDMRWEDLADVIDRLMYNRPERVVRSDAACRIADKIEEKVNAFVQG
jgi:spore coat polysaccharide biosynthesis predicted glycosyltransferase SpsG